MGAIGRNVWALLTRPSTRPKVETVWVTMASTCALSLMSQTDANARAPRASISATVRSARWPFHSATVTDAPCLARCRAIPRPMPWPAPVTITTRPSTPCWVILATVFDGGDDWSLYLLVRSPAAPSRCRRRLLLADAAIDLDRDGVEVLVDVVDAALPGSGRRVLDGRRVARPLDRLHLVVDRAVRAVHRELVTIERARPALSQHRVGVVAFVLAVVDQPSAAATTEREGDLLVILLDIALAEVGDHGAGDRSRSRRAGQRVPVGPAFATRAHEVLAGVAQRA